MKINEMSQRARNSMLPSYLEIPNFSESERKAALYADLSLSLSTLIVCYQQGQRPILLKRYAQVLCRFLLVGSGQNMIDRLLLDHQKLTNIAHKWRSKSLNTLYLVLCQEIQNAYFKHQVDDIVHAWHLLLKLGIVDMGFTPQEIEHCFFELYSN